MCIDVDKATAKLRRQLEKVTARYQKRLAIEHEIDKALDALSRIHAELKV